MTSKRPLLRSRTLPHILAVALGAAGCVGVAFWAKNLIELQAARGLSLAMSQSGNDWVEVDVDGLSVTLSGMATDEATRFAALSAAGRVVDASRIIDGMDVIAAEAIKAPDFSIEMLKNEDGVSLIGLVPTSSDPGDILERVQGNADGAPISDLLESANFDAPEGWERALAFGIEALDILPRSKVSITARRVAITAVAKDADDKLTLERQLNRDAPPGLQLALNISAPRPVVAPFTLRFLIDDAGARFDACAAASEAGRAAILEAATSAGMTEDADCVLALGTPTTRWGEAAAAGINALSTIGAGTLTMSNADVTVVAKEGTSPAIFERSAAELEAALPPVFSLSMILPEPPEDVEDGAVQPPEFTATRAPDGQIQLRGKLGDAASRSAVESFAAAHFGSQRIYSATLLDPNVPSGWPLRVLSALEAMQFLNNGVVTVTTDNIAISGQTGAKDAQARITRILSSNLESGAAYQLDVAYVEALDPASSIPTPQNCIKMITDAGARRKITFAPSSTDFESEAVETIDSIAEILRDCTSVRIEIGGHTDSQGRDTMNDQLSQARADAVLNAIMARRVLVSNLTAKGYGETQPIADNDSDAGREANRRIEFRLVTEDEIAEASDDGTDEDADTDAATDDSDGEPSE